jgi:ABC-type phosphate transport system substrate-binding protein
MKRLAGGVIGLAVLVAAGAAGEAVPGDVAVIVSKESALSEVSFHELVKIFKAEKQYFEGGRRIYLVMRESGAMEKALVLKTVYRMDEDELKRFWLGKLYRGEIPAFPKTLGSNEAVKRFVSQVPNAVGFVDAAFVDDSVKVLRIDGRAPGERGYALSDDSL